MVHSDETLASGRGGKITNKAGYDGARAPRCFPVLMRLLVEHIDCNNHGFNCAGGIVTGSLEGTALLFPLKVSCSFIAGGVMGDKDIPKRG